MKQINNYNRAVQYFNKIFKSINSEYFAGSLEMPTITVQSTVGAYGHVTTSKVWMNENGTASYELNIGADYLNRPIENLVATLIHEGCHLYAMQNHIKDTSNRGIYHNKRFRELAEARGLIISRHSTYGWTVTEPSEETMDFCIRHDLQEIRVSRNGKFAVTGLDDGNKNGTGDAGKPIVTKGNSRKWVCPCCGTIIRSTRAVRVVCADCQEMFVPA